MSQRHSVDSIETATVQWYRQFWPWFLLALIGSVVVASLVTVAIAFVHSDNLVNDSYYRQGLAINQQLARDEKAAALNIQAKLNIQSNKTITVAIYGDISPAEQRSSLQVLWQHPTASSKDFTSTLAWQSENLFATVLEQYPAGRWYITLQPQANNTDSSRWRLKEEVFISAPATNTSSAKNTATATHSFDLRAR